MNVSRRLAAVAILAALSGTSIGAQTDQGRIAGTVRDQSNAFASSTPVRVKNERTGEERTAVTNDKGYFLVSGLRPSTYTIRSSAPASHRSNTPPCRSPSARSSRSTSS